MNSQQVEQGENRSREIPGWYGAPPTTVSVRKYANGGDALAGFSERGPEFTASVFLEGKDPGEGFIWLRTWGGLGGLPYHLRDHGIVEFTGETTPVGPYGVEAKLAKLLI